MHCNEYRDITSAHVDGVLPIRELREAERHLEHCSTCHGIFVWEKRSAKEINPKLKMISVPPGAKERLHNRLEKEGRPRKVVGWGLLNARMAASVAVLLVVVVGALIWQGGVEEDLLSDTVAQYRSVVAINPGASRRVGPSSAAAHRLDLSPWGYRLSAKHVYREKGQERRVFVYEGEVKQYVLAQEFEGADALPSARVKIIRHKDRDFLSYSEAGVNLVAWKDKSLLCVLASSLPNEKLLSLASHLAEQG